VTLACPATANRIDQGLAAELREVCRQVREDQQVHVLVITGAGDAFSVGRDDLPAGLAGAAPQERLEWLARRQVASVVAALPIPVVVAINGDALDHGLELALSGDLRIAAAHARFGIRDLPRASFPWDGGTQRLPRLVGPAWARDLLLTGRLVDATESLAIGLVNRVVEATELAQEAERVAAAIAAAGPIAARYAKEAVTKGLDLPLGQGLRLEADLNILLQTTADRAEGLRAFRERRSPRFMGE
jgi:enoyl-CoA hydratase/carnithine racemase